MATLRDGFESDGDCTVRHVQTGVSFFSYRFPNPEDVAIHGFSRGAGVEVTYQMMVDAVWSLYALAVERERAH